MNSKFQDIRAEEIAAEERDALRDEANADRTLQAEATGNQQGVRGANL